MSEISEREALLNATISHVPFDGMNDRALLAGAESIGMSEQLARLHFPRAGADIAIAYHRRADTQLAAWLQSTAPQGRFRDRIGAAVFHRLSLVEPDIVRAAATVLALPHNSAIGVKLIWESADIIWNGLGDTSEDANWYTKRATLSAVIGSTVLFWLGDKSAGYQDTQDFLDRRIDGVMSFEKAKQSLRKLPGVSQFADLAFGWIRPPHQRNLPGHKSD